MLRRGQGRYQNSNGECEDVNVLVFKPAGPAKVKVIRVKQVVSSGGDPSCTATPETTVEEATVATPPE